MTNEKIQEKNPLADSMVDTKVFDRFTKAFCQQTSDIESGKRFHKVNGCKGFG